MSNTTDRQARWNAVFMPNYGTPAIAIERGNGVRITDVDGREYLDLLAGIAVSSLGHGHPALVAAVSNQVQAIAHTSNFYINEPALTLAERLQAAVFPGDARARVFLCNSGTEANEAAFKIARRTGKGTIISAHGGFHGRTMGSLALTAQPKKQAPFAPLPSGVEHVEYGNIEELRAAVGPDTAAVFLEPIQGEGGVLAPSADYLRAAREITRAAGALLILDEVQTGIARTGTFLGFESGGLDAADLRPDIVTLAKGLGGGLPIGAVVATGPAAALLEPGMHGTTFGGNPVAAAAANAVLDTIEKEQLAGHARDLGEYFRAAITDLEHPGIVGVRGRGLLLGIELAQPHAAAIEVAGRAAGFLINACQPNVVRIAPPLIVTAAQLDTFISALPAIIAAASKDAA